MFSELHFDFIRLIGDLQLRVQSLLSLLQPVSQLPPSLVELTTNTNYQLNVPLSDIKVKNEGQGYLFGSLAGLV